MTHAEDPYRTWVRHATADKKGPRMTALTDRLHAASLGSPDAHGTHSRRSLVRALAGSGLAGVLAAGFVQPGFAKKRKTRGTKDTQSSKQDREGARVAEIMAEALNIEDGSGGDSGDGSGKGRNAKGGRLVLDETKLDGLSGEQVTLLKRFVADVNGGKLGIAVTDKKGRVVAQLGSDKALEAADGPEPDQIEDIDGGIDGDVSAQNSILVDGWGLHYYIDPNWTRRLRNRKDANVINLIGASLQRWLCYYGIACLPLSTTTYWVRYTLRPLLRRKGAYDCIIHAPWTGYVCVQIGSICYVTGLYT